MNIDIRSNLRTEIEMTRHKFHRLLVNIPEAALKLLSKDPSWSNDEVLYRMSVASLIIPHILKNNAAENPSLSSIPQTVKWPVIHQTMEVFVRSRAANSNHWSIAWQYDQTCALVLEVLDGISDNSFDQLLQISDSVPLLPGLVTVEQLFHYSKHHFDTYSQQLNLDQ
ncbi:MAG TPA: hypothetical protein VFR47_22465 [Anaerolineales bacterium]|nr:hypothetical protein [Anaerolineales bacterium]